MVDSESTERTLHFVAGSDARANYAYLAWGVACRQERLDRGRNSGCLLSRRGVPDDQRPCAVALREIRLGRPHNVVFIHVSELVLGNKAECSFQDLMRVSIIFSQAKA